MKTCPPSFHHLAAIGILALAGCAGGYQAPSVQHVYTTSTQDYHDLSGASIRFDDPNTIVLGIAEGISGAKTQMVYFVDGREAFRHPKSGSFETLIQLPPGTHELLIIEEARTGVTLNTNSSQWRQRYRFKLKQGETATIQGVRTPGQLYGAVFALQGFDSVKLVESIDWNGAKRPDSTTFTSEVTREATSKSSPEQKLQALKALRAKGLISEEDYSQEKAQILSAITSHK